MKTPTFTLLTTLALSPFLVQCASRDDMQTLNYQLMTVNQKVEDMKVTTVDQMQRKQAVSFEQLDQMQQEVLALAAKTDEVIHRNQALASENSELKTALSASLEKQEMENKKRFTILSDLLEKQQSVITAQQTQIQAIQTNRLDDARERAQNANQRAQAAREQKQSVSAASTASGKVIQIKAELHKQMSGVTPSTEPSAPVAPKVIPVAAEKKTTEAAKATLPAVQDHNLLNQGRSAQKAGHFQDAYDMYNQALKDARAPSDQAMARFLMGETRFQQKEYDQAILEYQEVISKFSNQELTPTALLRQAEAFEALSDNDTAKIIYKKILGSYPNSPEALELSKKGNNP